jgi:hypothetical protein
LILEGVKLSEMLSPTPKGRTTWTVPGWVDVEVAAEEVEVAVLDVRVVVDDEVVVEVVELDKVEEVVVVLDVELAKALVVEEVEAEVLGLVDALDPVEDVEVLVWVFECSVVVDEGWKNTLLANAPARMTSAMPAMSTTVQSRPARPRDLLPYIVPRPRSRRAFFCLPLDDGELREA